MEDRNMKRYETDLYAPIRDYFTKRGFEVYGEVQQCDVTAVKDDELVVIELKLGLTIDLLIQATKRQRLTEAVYLAIPKPKYRISSKKWQDICYLVRRLELGLIIVSFLKSGPKAEVILTPTPFDQKKSMHQNKKKRERILKEIAGRHADYNVGGSSKTKLMTAYKENSIHIACLLDCHGQLSPKQLRAMGTGDKTLSILNKNYYCWFDKVQRGIYALNEMGKTELSYFPEQVKYFTELQKKP